MSAQIRMTLRAVAGLLSTHTYRFGNEVQLHQALAGVLTEAGYTFEQEVRVDAKNRFDFLLPDGLVIEVKADGPLSGAARQCDRYATLPQVKAVLLASSEPWAGKGKFLEELRGKPFAVAHLRRQAL